MYEDTALHINRIKECVQTYKFLKILRCFQQNSHCRASESCRTLKIFQNMSNRCKLKVTEIQPTPVYTFGIFSKSLSGGVSFIAPPPTPPTPPCKVEIGLNKRKSIKKFATDDIEISSDDSDEENSDKENSDEEN